MDNKRGPCGLRSHMNIIEAVTLSVSWVLEGQIIQSHHFTENKHEARKTEWLTEVIQMVRGKLK